MNSRLNFDALPFDAYDGFATHPIEHDEFKLEEEHGGGGRGGFGGARLGRLRALKFHQGHSSAPGRWHHHHQRRYDGAYGAQTPGDDQPAPDPDALSPVSVVPPVAVVPADTPPPRGAASPTSEIEFEPVGIAPQSHNTGCAECDAVASRIASGHRDPTALVDIVFYKHPDHKGRKLQAVEPQPTERKAILRDVVKPLLAGTKPISDREIAAMLSTAAKKIPDLGITIEGLLTRHQAEAGGIPIEMLLAVIHRESGGHFDRVTACVRNQGQKKNIPQLYKLGIFQTPAGHHGCTHPCDAGTCTDPPPGHNFENSPFGKGWHQFAGVHPDANTWKDPTLQVRVGLWDLTNTAKRVRADFVALFPSTRSEWFLRMAVLYASAAGAGAARSYLRKYKKELAALPEGRRWDFLRDKYVGGSRFDPAEVDYTTALATKFRAVRRSSRKAVPDAAEPG